MHIVYGAFHVESTLKNRYTLLFFYSRLNVKYPNYPHTTPTNFSKRFISWINSISD